jgi:hypothetical protein
VKGGRGAQVLEKLNKMGFVRREGRMLSKHVPMVVSVTGIIVSVFVSASR